MDIRSCCGAASRCSSETIHLVGQQQPPPYDSASRSRKPVKWRGIWTRLVKERRGHHVDQFQVPSYDSYTYAQNFDQGVSWDDPENISRSFSVRFANPALLSRNYAKKNNRRTEVEVS